MPKNRYNNSMDSFSNLIKSKRLPAKKDPHLHSASHLLADELANKLRDRAHFGFYLKMATTMPHDVLRKICGEILEKPNVETPGRLFAYLIKKYNQERKSTNKV